jgi:hypothetical protein
MQWRLIEASRLSSYDRRESSIFFREPCHWVDHFPSRQKWNRRRHFLRSVVLGVGVNPCHGVRMKQVGWLRKVCLGSCANAAEQDNSNGLPSERSAFSSRATVAEATVASATAAVALAVLAIGGMAVGFLVIGRLIVREMLVQRVHLRRLKIDQLEVDELRVSKLTILEGEGLGSTTQK